MSTTTINQPPGTPPAPNGTPPVPPTRPEHIPEKFWNAEKGEADFDAMARSYAELERKMSAGTQPPPTPPPPAPGDAQPPTLDALQAQAQAEFLKDGKLADGTYTAFEKLGVPRALVDSHIAGVKALADMQTSQLYSAVGGKDAYAGIIEWARVNLTADEAQAFDAEITSGDMGRSVAAARSLADRFARAEGTPGQRVQAKPVQTGNDVFQSKAEMVKAMSDPRYRKGDAAYHAEVQRKLAASMQAGLI